MRNIEEELARIVSIDSDQIGDVTFSFNSIGYFSESQLWNWKGFSVGFLYGSLKFSCTKNLIEGREQGRFGSVVIVTKENSPCGRFFEYSANLLYGENTMLIAQAVAKDLIYVG